MIKRKLIRNLTKFSAAAAMILTVVFLCCGCTEKSSESKAEPSRSAQEIKQQLIDDNNAVKEATVDDYISVQYYTVDVTTNSLSTEEMLIDPKTKVDCQMICNVVFDALEDQSVFIDFLDVSMADGIALVNISGDFTDENDLTEETESSVLDAISQSLLDNVADCTGVSFLTDGEPYASQYRSFDENYVYMEN